MKSIVSCPCGTLTDLVEGRNLLFECPEHGVIAAIHEAFL